LPTGFVLAEDEALLELELLLGVLAGETLLLELVELPPQAARRALPTAPVVAAVRTRRRLMFRWPMVFVQ
jgi:hypothetical protein